MDDARQGRTGRGPAGLSTAVSDAAELLAGESGTSRSFLGGLVAGALVGAAIAGASLVRSRAAGSKNRPRPGA